MRIALVTGTRPEILKNYSIVKALRRVGVAFSVIHTNQHSDYLMGGRIFEEMGYAPDLVMEPPYEVGRAITWLSQLVVELEGDTILVNGDTAASVVAAIAALYTDRKLAHAEAGLRSFDDEMREERNRIVVDGIADYLYAYTESEASYLRNSPEIRGQVLTTGNTTLDLIVDFWDQLGPRQAGRYAFVTLHRKELTDRPHRMRSVFRGLARVAELFDGVVFPMHPRTRDAMNRHGIDPRLLGKVTVIPPVSGLDSLAFQRHAEIVITDSGCVQEEAYLLGVPCVTVRENTERHQTIQHGANRLVGFDPESLVAGVGIQLGKDATSWPPVYGTYGAGSRVVRHLLEQRDLGVGRPPSQGFQRGAAGQTLMSTGRHDASLRHDSHGNGRDHSP